MSELSEQSGGEVGYADALSELDEILRELDGDDVDVDRLADRVERAQQLIALCRRRIANAQVRVDEIMRDPEADVGSDPTRAP